MASEVCTVRAKSVAFNESSINFTKAFYNGIGQEDSVCSFEFIAQSCFYAKLFVCK